MKVYELTAHYQRSKSYKGWIIKDSNSLQYSNDAGNKLQYYVTAIQLWKWSTHIRTDGNFSNVENDLYLYKTLCIFGCISKIYIEPVAIAYVKDHVPIVHDKNINAVESALIECTKNYSKLNSYRVFHKWENFSLKLWVKSLEVSCIIKY